MKNNILPLAANICAISGLYYLCSRVYGGLGLILMFHRVTNEPEKRADASGVISAGFFDRLLDHIRNSGTDIIFLRDVPQAIAQRRKFVCLTFDDGYRDNAEIALPVLRRHEAPATIFVPGGVLDRTLDSWWLQIEELAKKAPEPAAAYERMVARFENDPEARREMRILFRYSNKELNERCFLSASEIRQLSADPLIDIGGHTINHPYLRELDEVRAFREIRQNKVDLEDLLGRPVETFAFPFGNRRACGPREYELVRMAGYKVAVTTRDGNIFPAHGDYLTALPRYSVRGYLEDLAIYEMQRSGTYRALRSRLGPAFVTD
jgi:peptidoglycan/xylan/chitin deacetylase (PgdA/CDA1 family)